jgi:hypothetical protein
MHSILFASLSACILLVQRDRPGRRVVVVTIISVLGIALLQETIQAISVHNLRITDTLFDLCVDTASGGIPIAVFGWLKREKEDLQIRP